MSGAAARSTADPTVAVGRGAAALVELRIRDLGVIREAELALGPGLTVLTGETGAGKTMVVTAVTLLFGGRADASRVRPGAEQAVVDGRLALPEGHPALRRVLDAGGELDDDGTVTLRRTVAASGRSRAHAGGAPVPVAVLTEVGAAVLALHGQSDQLRLARPAEQRAALDRFAAARDPGFAATLARWQQAHRRWREAARRLHERRTHARELRREADLLRHGLAAVEAAGPRPDEDVELAAREARLAHLDALREAARAAHDAVLGDADDPTGEAVDVTTLLGRARWALEHTGADDEPRLVELARRVTDLGAAVADVGAELSGYLADLDAEGADPGALAQVQARRHVLAQLVRTYGEPDTGDGVRGVLAWAEGARARLAELDDSDEAVAQLVADADAARAEAAGAASALSAGRRHAAAALAAAVSAEVHGLAMAAAAVEVQVSPRGAGVEPRQVDVSTDERLEVDSRMCLATADGTDEVAILLRPHPDAPALPVHRGASGGELSRVMLALEAVLAVTEPVPLLVFDEVDAGVGGRAAVEVGTRLARLAGHHQVLVVTHLAQVAAAADAQVVVARGAGSSDAGPVDGATGDPRPAGGVSAADVVVLTSAQRVPELARMLSGSDSPTARRHAEELLDAAVDARDGGEAEPDAPPAARAPRRTRARVATS